MSPVRQFLVAATLVLGAVCALFAQYERPSRQLSVDVDLVLVPVTVTNERGQYIGGLENKHFHVYEDKIEQTLTYFSTEDTPMSLGIVLDSSGSMEPIMAPARRNGGACMEVGTKEDEYFLIVFSDKLRVNTDFTSDLQKLRMALLTIKSKGSTALYDAIYAGMEKLKLGTRARKALVVVSDGVDNHSRYSVKNVRESIKETDIQLYLIGNQGDGILRQLAEDTGGRALAPRARTFELGNICNQVVRDLKNQYLLGYHSSNPAKDGKWRNIKVRLDPPEELKLNVRARTGYFAGTAP